MQRNKRIIYRVLPIAVSMMTLLWLAGCSIPVQTGTSTSAPSATTTVSNATAAETSAAINRLISPEEAKGMIEANPDIVLLDVRTEEEYAAGYIPGSQLLPYNEIESRLDELPADRSTPIIIYCRSGNRSAVAASVLAQLGFTELYDLGGIISWPYETVRD